jgi:uncharacterized protein with HEPN domain
MREKIKDKGRLEHIKSAIDQIIAYKQQYDFSNLQSNAIVFYGFVKLVEIIGEAVYMFSQEFRSTHKEVNWDLIEHMRHVLVHGYYTISPETLWETIENDIPELKRWIDMYLNDDENSSK